MFAIFVVVFLFLFWCVDSERIHPGRKKLHDSRISAILTSYSNEKLLKFVITSDR